MADGMTAIKVAGSVLALLISVHAKGYAFGSSRSAASTEIFGYDRATLPRTGRAIRTDAFVSIASTERTFRLGDLRVLGAVPGTPGAAGAFSFYVADFSSGRALPQVDEQGRALEFHWYDIQSDDPALAREPGWYDADGKVRWDDDYSFRPGQAFMMQGDGLVLETNGQVLDVELRWPVPHNSYVLVGQPWAKHANLCELKVAGNGEHNIGGGVNLQTLLPSLRTESLYPWFDVTHGVAAGDPAYRTPGFYRDNTQRTPIAETEGIRFDLGGGFFVQGYQANKGEPAPDCELVLPKLELKMNDYQPEAE